MHFHTTINELSSILSANSSDFHRRNQKHVQLKPGTMEDFWARVCTMTVTDFNGYDNANFTVTCLQMMGETVVPSIQMAVDELTKYDTAFRQCADATEAITLAGLDGNYARIVKSIQKYVGPYARDKVVHFGATPAWYAPIVSLLIQTETSVVVFQIRP